jgi:hypothetical protein
MFGAIVGWLFVWNDELVRKKEVGGGEKVCKLGRSKVL